MNQDSPSPPRLAPVTPRGQRARLRLLHAAEEVFGEKSYSEASIADICRRADTALGSFYVYFPDKKAAFVELVDMLGHRLRSELAAVTKGRDGRLEVERAGLRAFFAFAKSHRRLYRIVSQAEFVDEGVFRRYHERLAEAYVRGLSGAMSKGEIRTVDAEVLAYALMGMADFLGMRWVLWGDGGPTERIVDSVMDVLEHGLGSASQKKGQSRKKGAPKTARKGARRERP